MTYLSRYQKGETERVWQEQLRYTLGNHRTAIVGVQSQLPRLDPLFFTGGANEFLDNR